MVLASSDTSTNRKRGNPTCVRLVNEQTFSVSPKYVCQFYTFKIGVLKHDCSSQIRMFVVTGGGWVEGGGKGGGGGKGEKGHACTADELPRLMNYKIVRHIM